MSWSRMATIAAAAVVLIVGINVLSIVRQAGTPPAARAYLLVQADVTDAARYAEYVKLSPGIVEQYGGRYLARGGRHVTLEGPPAKSRVVVVEFPSMEAAERFYRSPEYTAARRLREGAATAQFVVVEAQ